MFSSKKTKDINLIPESEAAANLSQAIFPLVMFGLLILATIAIGGFLFFLNNQEIANAKDKEDKIAAQNAQWQKIASVAAQVGEIKSKLTSYQGFVSKYPPIENYIASISKKLPDNVSLTSLDISNTGVVSLQAKAPSAAAAYQFSEVFNKETDIFSKVKLSGVTRAADKEEYTLSLTMVVAK